MSVEYDLDKMGNFIKDGFNGFQYVLIGTILGRPPVTNLYV